MKYSSNFAFRAFLFLAFFCGIGLSVEKSQENPESIAAELRANYNWGSIYLTYKSVFEFIDTLDGPRKAQISREHSPYIVNIFSNFLKSSIGRKINEGIAILEIDLNIMKAGFLRSNEGAGTITQLSWNRTEVAQIAHLCDKLKKGAYRAQVVFSELNSPYALNAITLEQAINKVQEIQNDPYVSPQRSTVVFYGLRTFIEQKPEELSKLKQANPDLYASLTNFKSAFDTSLSNQAKQDFQEKKRFSDETLSEITEQPYSQSSLKSQNLEKASAYIMRPFDSPKSQFNNGVITLSLPLAQKQSDAALINPNTERAWEMARAELLGRNLGTANFSSPDIQNKFKLETFQPQTDSLTPQPKNLKVTGKIGEKISAETYNITVINIETTKQYDKAAEPTRFDKLVSVEIVIESQNDYGVNINPQYTRLKDSNFYEYLQTTNGKEPSLKTNVNLLKGEKVRGWITFKVSENSKGLIFIYQQTPYDTRKVYIDLNQ